LHTVGGVHLVLARTSKSSSSPTASTIEHDSQNLVPIMEESEDFSEDHFCGVEFDLLEKLEDSNSLNLMTISGNVIHYCPHKVPMGSVHSVFSSQLTSDCHNSVDSASFNMIVDGGCTQHMIPTYASFICDSC
jgi:hypothetical protein